MTALNLTPLHTLHLELGARMVPFAGYDMPLNYRQGLIAEHQWTRASAGLFDVSHMGLVEYRGPAAALESVAPSRLTTLSVGHQRYTVLTTDSGGILDDLIVARLDTRFLLVVNAATKHAVAQHLSERLGSDGTVTPMHDRALIALQGPESEAVLGAWIPAVRELAFMDIVETEFDGVPLVVARSGYTGEDGFEIALPAGASIALARALLKDERVAPVGLGARDTLRLEAGLPLAGADIGPDVSPVEADLAFVVRRDGGGDYPGAERLQRELATGTGRARVGLRPVGRVPVRAGAELSATDGAAAGRVTSGAFAPSVGAPVAMGLVSGQYAAPGTRLAAQVRGRAIELEVVELPFVAPRQRRRVPG